MNKTWRHLAAELISLIANPVLLLIVAATFISYRYADDSAEFFGWLAVALCLLVVPGLIYSAFIWVKERKIDIDISNREDRVVPLMLSTLGAMIAGYLLINHGVRNPELLLMNNVLVALLIALTIITTIWKVSLHTATTAALSTLLVLFGGTNFIWLFALLIPVAWSRLFLKQHTPAQLIAGTAVGVIITFVSFKVFGG